MIFLNMDEAFTFLEEVVYPSFAELIQKTAFPEKKPIESAAEKNLYNLYNDTSMEKFFSESLSSMPTLTKRFITLSHTERSKRKCFSKDLEPPQNINLTPHVLALERFRDVSPALVIAVYEDSLVLEPGDVGPLPLSHPIAQELIRSINEQTVSFPMFQKLKDSGAPFYDGNIVFGIVDYRRCAFHSLNSQPPGVQQRPHLFTPGMTSIRRLPEIHKVLLRIPYEVLSQDIHTHFNPSLAIEAEKKIIVSFSL